MTCEVLANGTTCGDALLVQQLSEEHVDLEWWLEPQFQLLLLPGLGMGQQQLLEQKRRRRGKWERQLLAVEYQEKDGVRHDDEKKR